MKRIALILLALCAIAPGCSKDKGKSGGNGNEKGKKTTLQFQFIESTEDIANPERGYYYPIEFHRAGDPADVSTMRSQRDAKRTLILLEFYLTQFVNSDISDAYLDMVSKSFSNVRQAGAKCVLRFAYSNSESQKPWDAEEKWVLRHIEQLKPLLQENSDIIFVLQSGFIGVWGEWYYTENFTDFESRKRVIDAELDALPSNRQIEVRTPGYKMKLFDIAAKDTITAATAHDGSALSRIGGHNDCFVASADDYGTYTSGSDRVFWSGDTRYTIMGGETCDPSTSYCRCNKSISELERYHWTYLNSEYNKKVLNIWKEEYCYDEASMRLGYHLFVQCASLSTEPKAGEPFNVSLNIVNDGFAAPQNPRDAYLIFTNVSGKEACRVKLDSDPRFWLDGQTTTVTAEVTLPDPGAYWMIMYLPDPEPKLKDNPLYAIRLANSNSWDPTKGYNKLTKITVQ